MYSRNCNYWASWLTRAILGATLVLWVSTQAVVPEQSPALTNKPQQTPLPHSKLSSNKQPAPNKQPVHIEADTGEINELAGTRLFQGNVFIRQGTMSLKADYVRIEVIDKISGAQTIFVRGTPATFRQDASASTLLTEGQANEITYDTTSGDIVMTGNASIERDGSTINSNRLSYNIRSQNTSGGAKNIHSPATSHP